MVQVIVCLLILMQNWELAKDMKPLNRINPRI